LGTATSAAALNAIAAASAAAHDGAVNNPQTFILTKGLDNVVGGAGNDVIIGAIDTSGAPNAELNTLSNLDIINGGAGIDTLKIANNGTDPIILGNLSSVEIVTVDSATALTVDSSTISDITNLNVTKAGGTITATAGATTSVDVSVKDSGDVTVNGGKDVNVALTDAVNDVVVGNLAGAAGAVTVDVTGKAAANNASTGLGNITVTGGKTVSVTQHATSSSSAIVADGTTETITQGNVVVNASSITTDVTVKQDAQVDAASRAAATGATEVASVKFSALKAAETVTVGGLTFTASKDLTAAQVAEAFANLSSSAVKPTDVTPTTATGDTQGSGVRANGVFTGSLLADWSSAAASADGTVVFTGKATTAMTDLVATATGTATATATTTTQGITAVTARNTLGVDNGTVTIAGGSVLKNVTVDGYSTGSISGTNAVLDTIKLANGGSFSVAGAAATLGLTADNVDGTVSVAAGTKTINAVVTGADAETTLVSATAETVNVSGSGNVIGTTVTGGLNVATAINTSGQTADASATFTIANGTVTTYTGGAGSDDVTVVNAGTAITKAINLGAGDDVLTLQGTVVVPTATLSGGAGTDTIAMNGASAASLSANGDFAAKIDGFEKLAITDKVAAATTVNMANMDGITYVVSNNSLGTSASGAKEVFTADFSTSGAVTSSDTITFAGQTVNLAGGETPAQIALKVAAAGGYSGWVVTGVNGSVVTFEAAAVGAVTDTVAADFAITGPDATTAAVAAPVISTQGSVTYTLDLTGVALYDTDTLTIGGVTVYTAPAAATTLRDATAVKAGVVALGTVTIGGVAYAITAGSGNNVILTATDAAAAASLQFQAIDIGADGNGFATGTPVAALKVGVATEVFVANFATSGAIKGADTIVFDGVTITLATGDTQTAIAAKVAAAVNAASAAHWTAVASGTSVTFTNKVAGVVTDIANGAFAINNVADTTGGTAKVVVTTTAQGVAAGGIVTTAALTLDKFANAGTLELVDGGAGVIVKLADATGSADSFNLVTKVVTGSLDFGTVTVAGVETIKFTATDTDTSTTTGGGVQTSTVTLNADKAAIVTIDGSSNVNLGLGTDTVKLTTIDASALTGNLTVTANGANAMTITGGAGKDVIHASVGTTAKADIINGGAGNDTIYVGSNGAKLTGGDGNDTFIVNGDGNKEANTYSEITDFKAGDILQLRAFNTAATAVVDVAGFGKLTATLNEATATFSNFVDAAIKQAAQVATDAGTDINAAVWFSFKGDTYVVVDNGTHTAAFDNGTDSIVKLTGINGDSLSWNATFATAALV
ncbi:hypothetical protein KW842_15645, partial [Duganella sp. sic0402]|uniref:beta strand repeat-containing protein n=2 Tax=Duganella sp. sic0402 TaxID=2854786 RepID=UPI001C48D50D